MNAILSIPEFLRSGTARLLALFYPDICQICRSNQATSAESYLCQSCRTGKDGKIML